MSLPLEEWKALSEAMAVEALVIDAGEMMIPASDMRQRVAGWREQQDGRFLNAARQMGNALLALERLGYHIVSPTTRITFVGDAQKITPPLVGDATFECPECRAMLNTADNLIRVSIQNGLRFQGVKCRKCGKSFTVEMLKAEADTQPGTD